MRKRFKKSNLWIILLFLLSSLIASAQDDIVGTWTISGSHKGLLVSEIKIRQRPDSTYQIKVSYTSANWKEYPYPQVITACKLQDNMLSWEGAHSTVTGEYYVKGEYVYRKVSYNPDRIDSTVCNYNPLINYGYATVCEYYNKYTCHFNDGVLSLKVQTFNDYKCNGEFRFRGIESVGNTVSYTNW